MIIKALKPCSFAGRDFKIGDKIPENLIHKENLRTLVGYGLIEITEGAPSPSIIKPEVTTEAEPTEEVTEEAELTEAEPTEDDLMKKTRDQLVEIAEGKGIEVKKDDTKKIIVAAILDHHE